VLICAPDGGIVNDPILLKLADDHFWLSLADSDARCCTRRACRRSRTWTSSWVSPTSAATDPGPKSKPLMRKLFGDEVADQRYY
jgi:aminomethyltransferase